MTSNEEELVQSVCRRKLVEIVYNTVEPLPLGQVAAAGVLRIGLINQTEVRAQIVECAWRRSIDILKEISADRRVHDVISWVKRVIQIRSCRGRSRGSENAESRGGRG
jgi:hypothetical protein